MKNAVDVYVPDGYKPKKSEREVAWILARHYKTLVRIIRPANKFKIKSADYLIDNVEYELKTPESNKVEKVKARIREGSHQSRVIIVYSKKTKILDKRMIEIIRESLREIKVARRIILVQKNKKVLEFLK